jgi:ligand-binding SRPBCC domain-containing protein
MHVYRLECEMLARRSPEEVFSVFQDPYNLAKITPPSLSFRVTSKQKVVMHKGAEIEYSIKWLGFPMSWRTVIAEYEPPLEFVDEQASGPYALWRHRHTFIPTSDGVRVADRVDYALPLGPLGRVAHEMVVGKQLRAIFRYRQAKLSELFGNDTFTTLQPKISAE